MVQMSSSLTLIQVRFNDSPPVLFQLLNSKIKDKKTIKNPLPNPIHFFPVPSVSSNYIPPSLRWHFTMRYGSSLLFIQDKVVSYILDAAKLRKDMNNVLHKLKF